jgi:hypothetical protein
MDWQEQPPESPDTVVDDAIRGALRQRAGTAEPPDHVWQRLSRQVAAGPAPQRRRRRLEPRTLNTIFAPFVQGLVATSLLLLLGLSLRSGLWEQAYRFGAGDGLPAGPAQPVVAGKLEVETAITTVFVEDGDDDVESLRTLMRAAKLAHQRADMGLATARPGAPEPTLPALNKLDDLVDARDVALEEGERAAPDAGPALRSEPNKGRPPVQQQPS